LPVLQLKPSALPDVRHRVDLPSSAASSPSIRGYVRFAS
jgi:hypothetical protein